MIIFMQMYRSNIELDKSYKFGVEIEFSRANLHKIYKNMISSCVPCLFELKHRSKNPDFNTYWYLDVDSTVTDSDGEIFKGGELSSKIFTDTSDDWRELKRVCLMLRDSGAIITPNCSIHVNADIKDLMNKPLFLETLVKLFFVYENDINLYFMGDSFGVRNTKNRYAANFGPKIIDHIDDKRLFEGDDIATTLFLSTMSLNKHCGLNLGKLYKDGLLEVRYGNGTLNEVTIQNFCNFVLKVISAIEDKRITVDFLDEEIKRIKSDPNYISKSLNYTENVFKFLELLDIISASTDDYEAMSNQYMKILNSKGK